MSQLVSSTGDAQAKPCLCIVVQLMHPMLLNASHLTADDALESMAGFKDKIYLLYFAGVKPQHSASGGHRRMRTLNNLRSSELAFGMHGKFQLSLLPFILTTFLPRYMQRANVAIQTDCS